MRTVATRGFSVWKGECERLGCLKVTLYVQFLSKLENILQWKHEVVFPWRQIKTWVNEGYIFGSEVLPQAKLCFIYEPRSPCHTT